MMLACMAISAVTISSFAQKVKQPAAGTTSAAAAGSATMRSAEPTAQQMAENRAKTLRVQYKLTEEQYQKTLAIETEYALKERQFRQQHPAEGVIVKMMMEKDQRYKDVMTPKQYESYSATRYHGGSAVAPAH